MKLIIKFLIFLLCLFSVAVYAQTENRGIGNKPTGLKTAEKRLALIIGNSNYQHTDKLKNPVNDANDMSATLTKLGFEVISGTDLTLPKMRKLVREFGTKLKEQKGVGLFYYAGHGIQVGGNNYLIPVDADIQTSVETRDYSVNSDLILRYMRDAGNEFNMVILDACRNNPFARTWRSYSPNRSLDVDKGLARITPPSGTIILYSTEPGSVASDGTGRNGLFTESLLTQLEQPNVEFDALVKLLARDINQKSDGKQSPWKEGLYFGDFYFNYNAISSQTASNNNIQRSEVLPKTNIELIESPRVETPVSKYKIGDTITNSILMELVWIPPGEFMMGSTDAEVAEALFEAKNANKNSQLEWFSIESPKHKVKITNGFWMGKFEVTQQQWEQVMGNNPSDYKDCGGRVCPVEQISWYDVQAFIKKLNAKESTYKYRLPTEAEWEYAARAGTKTPFVFGNSLSSMQARIDGRSPWTGAEKGDFTKKTAPVGSFQANDWGLYDMHGNVWEWVEDWYGPYTSGDAINPSGLETGVFRVIRGGSWVNFAAFARSSVRSGIKPDFREANGFASPLKRLNIGFRLVAVPK